MSFYGDLATTANELLAEFGQAVTIRVQTPGEYDPETATSAITTADTVGNGCVFDYGTHAIDGTLIIQGDKQLLLSPVGMPEPGIDSLAIVSGVQWRITRVKATAPAGVPVIYDCNIRK